MWRARVGKLRHTDAATNTHSHSRRHDSRHTNTRAVWSRTDTLGRQCDSAININVKGATTKCSSNMRRLVGAHTHTEINRHTHTYYTHAYKKDKCLRLCVCESERERCRPFPFVFRLFPVRWMFRFPFSFTACFFFFHFFLVSFSWRRAFP